MVAMVLTEAMEPQVQRVQPDLREAKEVKELKDRKELRDRKEQRVAMAQTEQALT